MTIDRLFDVSEFGGAEPTPFEVRAERQAPPAPVVEPLAPGYQYMRDRRGVMQFAHLIASHAPSGASMAACGKIGTLITNAGVESMIRCQECDLAQQLS
jgi:hypothetical protein